MRLRHLAEAEQHIARGTQHISHQELRIAECGVREHNSTLARALLETFRTLQAQHIAHRDHVLKTAGL
jgi:hypothetical protein